MTPRSPIDRILRIYRIGRRGRTVPWALLGMLLLAAPLPAAGEPAAEPAVAAPVAPAAQPTAVQAPKEIILCRSPRGAVFARDAAVGCKLGTRITPENLVDFGGARLGCTLRPVDETAASCDASCRAADARTTCVVGLRRLDGRWTTFAPGTPLTPPASDAGTDTPLAVCCRP